MRILSIHADSMRYKATKRTKIAEEIQKRGEDGLDECVVLFCCVERLDEKNPERVIRTATNSIMQRLEKLKVRRVLVYPYAHLASTLGSPDVALEVLRGLEAALREEQLEGEPLEVKWAPFGWYKEFEIRAKGHPLADLSMTICQYEGGECECTCPYCHNPFRAADAEHACGAATVHRGTPAPQKSP